MVREQPPADRRGNAILNALPAVDRDRLIAEMTLIPLKIKTILFDAGQVVSHVYFPTSGVISLVTPLEEGSIVEVATIGNEGIVGVPIQPHGSLAVRAISQVAGSVLRMDADAFLAETEGNGPLRDLVRNYTLALFGQISQAAACNRLHSSEEQLSRWLLMSRDRVGRDDSGSPTTSSDRCSDRDGQPSHLLQGCSRQRVSSAIAADASSFAIAPDLKRLHVSVTG